MTRRELMKLAAAAPLVPQDAKPLNICVARMLLNWNEQPQPHEPSGIRRGGEPVCKWCSCVYLEGL